MHSQMSIGKHKLVLARVEIWSFRHSILSIEQTTVAIISIVFAIVERAMETSYSSFLAWIGWKDRSSIKEALATDHFMLMC